MRNDTMQTMLVITPIMDALTPDASAATENEPFDMNCVTLTAVAITKNIRNRLLNIFLFVDISGT